MSVREAKVLKSRRYNPERSGTTDHGRGWGGSSEVRRLGLTLGSAALLLLASGTSASGDPVNDRSTTYSVQCDGMAPFEVTAVFFASGVSTAGATSAFHIVGSTSTVIVFTPGTDSLTSLSCQFTYLSGVLTPDWETFQTLGYIVGSGTSAPGDPVNDRSTTYGVQCEGMAPFEVTAVFFASGVSTAGATSAFHILGSTSTVIVFTPGTDSLTSLTCEFTYLSGVLTAGWETFQTLGYIVP